MRKPKHRKHRLDEIRIDQLISKSTPDIYREPVSTRSSGYMVKLKDVIIKESRPSELTAVFTVTKLGHGIYSVYISLLSFFPIYEQTGDIDMAFDAAIDTGDIAVYCTCPSWLYGGFEYIASKGQYSYKEREDRPPNINNPMLAGSVCKHVYKVLTVFEEFAPQIRDALERTL